jgi:hypothetical protein
MPPLHGNRIIVACCTILIQTTPKRASPVTRLGSGDWLMREREPLSMDENL